MRKNYQWGFIDQQGEWVIDPQYLIVSEFHHGVAAVFKQGEYGWQLINTDGKPVLDRKFRTNGATLLDHRPDIPEPAFE